MCLQMYSSWISSVYENLCLRLNVLVFLTFCVPGRVDVRHFKRNISNWRPAWGRGRILSDGLDSAAWKGVFLIDDSLDVHGDCTTF